MQNGCAAGFSLAVRRDGQMGTSDTAQGQLGSPMNRSVRYDIAATMLAFGFASFGTHVWIFLSYFSSHPKLPNVEEGFVHALNNHGSHVYVTDAEATGLGLLWLAFFLGILCGGLICPRPHPASAPLRLKIIFACSLLLS